MTAVGLVKPCRSATLSRSYVESRVLQRAGWSRRSLRLKRAVSLSYADDYDSGPRLVNYLRVRCSRALYGERSQAERDTFPRH